MDVERAIAEAEALLPGEATPDGLPDPRWQAIIGVSEYCSARPLEVWAFAEKWGAVRHPDVQAAVATCLVEHLLKEHFALLSPLVVAAVASNPVLRETVAMCWLPEDLAATEAGRRIGLRQQHA